MTMRAGTLLLLLTVSLGGCARSHGEARYLVTGAPLAIFAKHTGFCVAVEPTNPRGVWWWEPGKTGCASRSTGPTVFPAEAATVTHVGEDIAVQFQISMQSGVPVQIKLTIDDHGWRREPAGERVALATRSDLEVPELCCLPLPR